jgi:hypothetical protein
MPTHQNWQHHSTIVNVDLVTDADLADPVNLADLTAPENLAAPIDLRNPRQACPPGDTCPPGDNSALAPALALAPDSVLARSVWADTRSPATASRRIAPKTRLALQGVPVSPDTPNGLEWLLRLAGLPIVHTPQNGRATMPPNGTTPH